MRNKRKGCFEMIIGIVIGLVFLAGLYAKGYIAGRDDTRQEAAKM